MAVQALGFLLLAGSIISMIKGNDCVTLEVQVEQLEALVKSLRLITPRFSADLSRAQGTASATLHSLESWIDLPPGSFGGGWREENLRQSLSTAKVDTLFACSQASHKFRTLTDHVEETLRKAQLDSHTATQAHAVLASYGASMMNSNSRSDLGDIFMSTLGAKMVTTALQAKNNLGMKQERSLANAIDSLFVPHLHVSNQDHLFREARVLKEEAEKIRSQKSEKHMTHGSQASAFGRGQEAHSPHHQNVLIEDHEQFVGQTGSLKKTEKDVHPTTSSQEKIPFECPPELFNIFHRQNASQCHQRCLITYLSAIASQAMYSSNPSEFLLHTPRTLARHLEPLNTQVHANENELVRLFTVASTNIVIVVFKGTETPTDILTDISFNFASPIPGGIHAGFYKRSFAIPISQVIRLINAGKHVVLTGHSLGGAAATVLTLRLFYEEVLGLEYHHQVTCVTFGSPLVTGGDLRHGGNFLHVVLHKDVVPRLLILKKEIFEALLKKMDEVGFTQMLKDTASKLKAALPWKAQLVVELAERAYNVYKDTNSDEEWFTYKPFGEYMFIWRGQCHLQTGEDAVEFMKMMMPSLSPADLDMCLRDHSVSNYAEALEALRTQSSQHVEL